jgi:hypothetical protein
MPVCFSCDAQLDAGDKPGRADTGSVCDADVHCCCNCEFYDPGSYNECRETQAERVLEKDRSNFCDYFAFRQGTSGRPASGASPGSKHNPLDNLFK